MARTCDASVDVIRVAGPPSGLFSFAVAVCDRNAHVACSDADCSPAGLPFSLPKLGLQGGVTRYHRDGAEPAFLKAVAAVVEAARPRSLVLLTASTSALAGGGSMSNQSLPHAARCFAVIGPAGENALPTAAPK